MIVFKKHIGECWVIFWVMFFFLIVRIFSSSSSSRVCLLIVGFFSRLLAVCLTVLFSQKNWDDFRSCLQFREQKPTGNGKQERAQRKCAHKPGVRWCRQGTNQNNSKLCFHRKKPSSELCLKISYRWLLDFCWFFVCTKVSQLLLLFEVVIRSKREYKVVHCVNLTIFFSFGGGLKLFDFFPIADWLL